jgi:hypothetical protein
VGRRSRDVVPGMLVWVVSFVSVAIQLLMTTLNRAWSWDEAIYLSQVSPSRPALPFVASRARGITLIVAPLTNAGMPGWAIRLALAMTSSVVLALVFRVWVPSVHMASPIGAALFAVSWPALLYGSEVMPNLWAGLFGVGVAGCLVRLMGDEARSRGLWAGLLATSGLMALMRPPDALVLALSLAVGVVLIDRRAWRALVPLAIGVIAGWLPWLVEMSVRFGGPLEALRQAQAVSHLAGNGSGALEHLALADGPLLGPDRAGGIPVAGGLWWVGLAALIVAGLALERRGQRATAVRIATIGGAGLAAEYIVAVSGLAPRFLLPSLALLSVGAGCGLAALWRSGAFARVAAAAISVLACLGAAWHLGTLRTLEQAARVERAVPRAVGEAIARELTPGDGPCVVASTDSYPQVAFAAGCRGRVFDPEVDVVPPGEDAVLFLTRDPLEEGRLTSLHIAGLPEGWFVHRR